MNVRLHAHLPAADATALAALFQVVDAAEGPAPWYQDVRDGGVGVARAILDRPVWYCAAARTDAGQCVGYAAVSLPTVHGVKLVRVMVDPERRGQGWAAALCGALLDRADSAGRAVHLEVLAERAELRAWYGRLGFEVRGHTRGSRSGQALVLMSRPPHGGRRQASVSSGV